MFPNKVFCVIYSWSRRPTHNYYPAAPVLQFANNSEAWTQIIYIIELNNYSLPFPISHTDVLNYC